MARENTERARQIIHYINRDFADFTHEYYFDEIITNMPFAIGRKTESEIREVYHMFFEKAKQHLTDEGIMILYTHDKEYVYEDAKKYGYKVLEEFEINKKEGTYVIVSRVI